MIRKRWTQLRRAWNGAAVERWRRRAVLGLWTGVVLAALLATVSFVTWRVELREIRRIVATEIDADAPPADVVRQARVFIRDRVGYGRPDSYFLLPIFRFMRPTALQVIREGGDCAYRTRAFIVILRQYGIEARKFALYDHRGRSVHAVAGVFLDGRTHYYDLLFNLAHVRNNGTPLTLDELARDSILEASIERAISRGNVEAPYYPLEDYTFDDVRTLNWEKNAAWRLAYRAAVATLGEERARTLPRPYLSEEPALMVITLALGGAGGLLILILIVRPRRAPAPRRAAEARVDAFAGN